MRAYVTRFTFPDTQDGLYNMEFESRIDLDSLLAEDPGIRWSLPKYVLGGDIVFFQSTSKTRKHFHALVRELRHKDDQHALGHVLQMQERVFRHAGHIVAVGSVASRPVVEPIQSYAHFKQRFFAPFSTLQAFKVPLPIAAPSPLCRNAEFTPGGPLVHRSFASDQSYQQVLSALRKAGNTLPDWLYDTHVRPVLKGQTLTKQTWREFATDPDAAFFSEAHLRQVFVDFFLAELADRGGVFEEVAVLRRGKRVGFVDNVVILNGQAIPVEVKLNVAAEPKLSDQIAKYTAPDGLECKGGKRLPRPTHPYVLVIDQLGVYLFANGRPHDCSTTSPIVTRLALADEGALVPLRKRIAAVVA